MDLTHSDHEKQNGRTRRLAPLFCGAVSGSLIVLSLTIAVYIGLAYTSCAQYIAEYTKHLKLHTPLVKPEMNVLDATRGILQMSYDARYLTLVLALLGSLSAIFRDLDEKLGDFRLLYTFEISRTFMFWYVTILIAFFGYATVFMRDRIVFDSISTDSIEQYSFWLLSLGYVISTALLSRVLKEVWLFWYNLSRRTLTFLWKY